MRYFTSVRSAPRLLVNLLIPLLSSPLLLSAPFCHPLSFVFLSSCCLLSLDSLDFPVCFDSNPVLSAHSFVPSFFIRQEKGNQGLLSSSVQLPASIESVALPGILRFCSPQRPSREGRDSGFSFTLYHRLRGASSSPALRSSVVFRPVPLFAF